MRWTIAVALLSQIAALTFADSPEPPPPNLKAPLDYVAWINQQYSVSDKPNAADKYLEAVKAFEEDQPAYLLAKDLHGRLPTDDELRTLRKWTDNNSKCLRFFAEAASQSACYFELEGEDFLQVQVPITLPMRNIGILLCARARQHLAEGDVNAAVADVATALQAGAHLRSQPLLIQYLVGAANSGEAYRVLRDLPLYTDKTIDYEDVIRRIRREDRDIGTIGKQLLTEKVYCWDILQRHCQDTDGDGKIDQFPTTGEDGVSTKLVDLSPPRSIDQFVAELDELRAPLLEIVGTKDFREAKKLAEKFKREVSQHEPLGELIASVDRADAIGRRAEAERRGVRMLLRIQAYNQKESRWPTDIATAARRDGATFRTDPFSDGELVYRLVDGEPLLYSLGADCKDDGGKVRAKSLDDDGDYVYWPLETTTTETKPQPKPAGAQ